MRFLGIDYGSKNIGLALSDEQGRFAYPYRVIPNTARAAMMVSKICEDEGVDQVVVGESKDFKGVDNPIAKEINEFKTALAGIIDLPIKSELEVLTTAAARRDIGQDDSTDARAAALILKSYLEREVKWLVNY